MLVAPLPASAEPLQEALLRAKPAVAIVVTQVTADVTVDCGMGRTVTVAPPPARETGTGWFVHASGWMITTANVVALAQEPRAVEPMLREAGVKAACFEPLLARRGLRPGQRPDVDDLVTRQLGARVTSTAAVKLDATVAILLANGTRVPARIVKYSAPAGGAMSGGDLALLKAEATNVPTLPLADSRSSKSGDRLHVIGFPNVVMTHELLNASATAEASITGGAISGFKEDVTGRPVIQTDASAASGDSGGPAVNDHGEVVGVMTFGARAAGEATVVQGFNFIVPAATVREFLKDTPVTPGDPGPFTKAWAAALSAFFRGDHAAASRHLLDADQLLPNVPDVKRMTAENDERIRNPPPQRFPWRAAGAALTMLGLLGCAVAWIDWWRRNRFRVRPRDIARVLEDGENSPVVLDVRDAETYQRSPVRIPRALHVPAERLAAGTTLPVETTRPVVAYCT
jgi:S1-C subfamily serine protease